MVEYSTSFNITVFYGYHCRTVTFYFIVTVIINFYYRRKHFQYMRRRSKDRRQMNYYSDLMVNKDMVKEIRLFDLDKERQEKVAVVVRWILDEDLKCGIKLTTHYDEESAYKDADFIFAQMRVGKYAMREMDEKIPLKHGCVGQETCGCGGLAYGLRTIFPMMEVIDYAEKYAKPTYWILNYSNPASIVSEACRVLRPKARIINICDMPIAIIDVVAAALEIEDKENIVYDYYGLNHFGWFTGIEYKGQDMMPKLREYIMEHEILLPAAYLLSLSGNVNMVWWSFPIAEVVSLFVTLILFARIFRKKIRPML